MGGIGNIVRNAIGAAGAGAVTFGVYSLNHAAAWIVGGLFAIISAAADAWLPD